MQLITICAVVKSKCAVENGKICTKDHRDSGQNDDLWADCQVLGSCKSCSKCALCNKTSKTSKFVDDVPVSNGLYVQNFFFLNTLTLKYFMYLIDHVAESVYLCNKTNIHKYKYRSSFWTLMETLLSSITVKHQCKR